MDEFEKLIENMGGISISERKTLGKTLLHGIKGSDINDVVNIILEDLPPANLKNAVVKGTQKLPEPERKAAVQETAAQLTKPQQEEVVKSLRSGGLGPPKDKTRDLLWLIVVSAFAFVLVASFVAIAASMFKAPAQGALAKPELVLTMFTGVVGFLAGLFVPSPAANKEQ